MELVLVPGEVLLNASNAVEPDHKPSLLQGTSHRMMKRASIRSDKDSKITLVHQFPGYQLMATCRQACAEGHTVFYSSNDFFLLQGPLKNIRHGLEALQPQHRAMIKQVGIMMTLNDITLANLDEIFDAIQVRYGEIFMLGTQPKDIRKEKLNFILRQWEDFVFFRITPTGEPEASDSTDLAGTVEMFWEEDDDIFWSPHVRWMRISSLRPAKDCRSGIREFVRNEGWKAVRALLD